MSKTIYTEIANPNGNFLFTVEQLNNAKTNDKCLPCKCVHCGEIFYISRKNYISVINKNGKGSFQFCSCECSQQYRMEHSTSITKPCLLCGKLVTKPRCEAISRPNFFCCSSHAATYNNKRRSPRSEESRAKTSATLKAQQRKRPPKPCKVCGQYPCAHTYACKGNWLRTPTSINRLKFMGFNIDTLGSLQIVNSYDEFRNYIFTLYMVDEMSQSDLAKKFGFPCSLTISLLFKWLQIPVLSKHDQRIRTILKMKKQAPICSNKYRYKHGYHTTWSGDDFFYRSSYELDVCKQLDEQKILYEMEALRIRYYDTTKQKDRVAIPDFYLPQSNTIVEVKSNHTYDKQNMIDRSEQYQKLGYNFKLILDHQEYNYCP